MEPSSNNALAELTLKDMADPALLEPSESLMFTHHVTGSFMIWFKIFLQFKSGLAARFLASENP